MKAIPLMKHINIASKEKIATFLFKAHCSYFLLSWYGKTQKKQARLQQYILADHQHRPQFKKT